MNQLSIPQIFAVWVLPVLFAITVHEVAHGWIASKFGDPTAKLLGRLTLNPIKHIDLLGTIIIPSILLFLGGFIFGWAKPVPVNWHNLKHPKRDMALVAAAGPSANFMMAFGWAIIAKAGTLLMAQGMGWALAIIYMGQAGIMINLMLMYLNLLPIPPLDGWRVVAGFLPTQITLRLERFEPLGFLLLLLLLAVGILSLILIPPILATQHWITNLFGIASLPR